MLQGAREGTRCAQGATLMTSRDAILAREEMQSVGDALESIAMFMDGMEPCGDENEDFGIWRIEY